MPYIQKLERIQLVTDSKYWVDVYPEVTWATMKKVSQVDEAGNTIFQVDALLSSVIKAWNLDDAEGNILPLTAENIDLLKKTDIEKIVNVVGGSIQETEDAKKAS